MVFSNTVICSSKALITPRLLFTANAKYASGNS
jgi:hypothetical protein